ncbi:MAG TPA: SRPBCC family protein [Steroidobacteraceae bacterium]|jgi:uncharacterized protein YndB with AHSA1/START domain|nr:SRPBCC family protein [Steroidobacteraceae bacterium]
MNTDRIEKEILLNAPLERVWNALSDSKRFGFWFGVDFDGPFIAGARTTGRIRPTRVDPEVAALQESHAGTPFTFRVDRIEPMRCIAFRWHPYAIDSNIDYSNEPTTLITFELQPVGETTRLKLTESGFDQIPMSRRLEAFQANDGGWSHQMKLIGKYLALPDAH